MSIYYAIEFDRATCNRLAQRQLELKHNSKSGDWSDKESFHITVQYVGKDIIDRKSYMEAMEKLISKFNPRPFELTFQNFGFFGEQNEGRVAWIGLKNSLPLYQLKTDLVKVLKENNLEYDTKFPNYNPHITMGYDVEVNQGFNTKFEDNFPVTIKSLCLWDSFKANDTYITNKIYEVFFNGRN